MKIKFNKNTLLLIIGIIFILISGLSYLFYSKYKTIMTYINEQFRNYNNNIQNQMINLLDNYKKFVMENKPIIKEEEEDKNIENFINDLDVIEEEEIFNNKELLPIKEEEENEYSPLSSDNNENINEIKRNSSEELEELEENELEELEENELEELKENELEELEENELEELKGLEENEVENMKMMKKFIEYDEEDSISETTTNIDEKEEQIKNGLCTFKFKKRGYCKNQMKKNNRCDKHIYK